MSDAGDQKKGNYPSNIDQFKAKSPFQQESLNKRDHGNAELHYIGESLPVPSVILDTGVATVGTSPIPAREDHVHGGGSPIGSMSMWGGASNTIPTGWTLCDGRALSRTQYPLLFNAIGVNWGTGDGSTTFNIPDMRNTFPRGGGSIAATGGYADAVVVSHDHNLGGHTHGMANHTHTLNHTHDYDRRSAVGTAAGGAAQGNTTSTSVGTTTALSNNTTSGPSDNSTSGPQTSSNTGLAGMDGTNRNLPPYANVHFMIRAF